ncbi:hypothetical protein F511_10718 [Dorcoceras hygrometricum]|uniref:Splicing factor 3B subunit 1-like n=1 Tax=Dorcoceras hygrometricum TaxID=472368 RepID=A0A2Z7AGY0_9LAMI|nr:hypothetical protein F511_10718 [Dorcoceras hygrometricum]
MASALINNASQIYFDSIFGMENEGMVKMFKAQESSGLKGFLGCSSAIYEATLVEFFQNASFLKEPLRSGEDEDMSWSKKPSKIIEPAAVEKDKEIETVATEDLSLAKSVAAMTDSEDTEPLSKVLELTDKSKSDEEFMSIEDILKQIPEEMMLPSVTAAEITRIKFGRGIEIPGVRNGDCYKANLPQIPTSYKGKAPLAEKDEIKGHPAREMFSLICADIDFLVQLREKIPEEMMLPSVTAVEITRIKFGLGIEIPGVNEGDWYKASLPRIATSDKGKAPLVAKDEIKGHPAREMFSLICADIDFLVQIREKVIADVVSLFHSFILSRLAVFGSVKDIVAKEEQMLAWAETDSLETAVQRRITKPSAESYEGKMLSYQLMQTTSFCNRQLQTPTAGCTATGYFLYDVASSLALLFTIADSFSFLLNVMSLLILRKSKTPSFLLQSNIVVLQSLAKHVIYQTLAPAGHCHRKILLLNLSSADCDDVILAAHCFLQNLSAELFFFDTSSVDFTVPERAAIAQVNARAESFKEMDQLVCFWKFGPQCPTSPLLPPRKAPLEDFDLYNTYRPNPATSSCENS